MLITYRSHKRFTIQDFSVLYIYYNAEQISKSIKTPKHAKPSSDLSILFIKATPVLLHHCNHTNNGMMTFSKSGSMNPMSRKIWKSAPRLMITFLMN